MSKSNSTATVRVVLFGEISPKQLATVAKAGCELHSTDAPSDSFVRVAAHASGVKLRVHPAAWDNLTHPSSKPTVKFNDDGTSREFNANGGYTRDAVLAGSMGGVILGSGLSPSRRKAILDAATNAGVTVRETQPEAAVEYASPAEAAAVLDALKL